MRKYFASIMFGLLLVGNVTAADLFVETESFANKGGWAVDQQFMDLMGSPYLLAHGTERCLLRTAAVSGYRSSYLLLSQAVDEGIL